jgi:hypothetical protein
MTKRVGLVIGIAVVGFLTWRSLEPAHPRHDAEVRVDGRFWIERVPASDRDAIDSLLMIDDADSDLAIGIFARASAWRGAHELFLFEADGDRLQLEFPQTGDHETVRARAYRCTSGDMDYCLELSGNSRGVARYVSREGWEIDAATAHDPAALEAATARLLRRAAP